MHEAYDEENPSFLKEISRNLREGGIDLIELLKEQGALKPEFEGMTFDKLYLGFLEASEETAATDTIVETTPDTMKVPSDEES